MESSIGESAELLTGRPVEGGIRLRSPEVAMGSGSGDNSVAGSGVDAAPDSGHCGCSCGWPARNSSVGAMVLFTSVALYGARKIKVNALERYESGILGGLLSLLGLFVIFFDT